MPELATFICFLFIGYLFWREFRGRKNDRISWVPFVWMFIAGSRFVSTWLNLRAPGGVNAYADGSPVDRAFFFIVILCGSIVLYRRRIDWPRLFKQNRWLLAYFLYCLCSVAWTDEPLILTKRWIKDLGNPLIVLILLTERHPYDAIATTIRRLSFLFLPLSVLFIKYYPNIGVAYAAGGARMYSGVGEQKNALGLICLTTGICYTWSVLHRRATVEATRGRYHIVMAAMLAWLLYMANSQTSLVCLTVTVSILIVSTRAIITRRPTRLISVVLGGASIYMIADAVFGVRDQLLALLGRDATLTNRATIWAVVSSLHTNPVVGVGFMSFWSGDRLKFISHALGADGLNQAHNGYLEQYLNLGYVGVAFIIAIVIASLAQIGKQLRVEYSAAILRFCFIVAALLYNYTEAAFYGINNMWLLLLTASIDGSGALRGDTLLPLTATVDTMTRKYASLRRRVAPSAEPSANIREVGRPQLPHGERARRFRFNGPQTAR